MASLGVWLRKSVICLNDCRNGRQASRPSQRGKWDRTDRAGVLAGTDCGIYLLSGGNLPGDSARMKHSDGQTVAGQTDQARKTKRQCRRKDCWLGDAAGDKRFSPPIWYATVLVASLRWSLCCAAVLCLAAVLGCYVPNHRAPVRIILTSCLPNPPPGGRTPLPPTLPLRASSSTPHPSPRGIRDSDLPKANYCASDYQGTEHLDHMAGCQFVGCLVLPTPRPAGAETFEWAALSRLARLVCLPSTQDRKTRQVPRQGHIATQTKVVCDGPVWSGLVETTQPRRRC